MFKMAKKILAIDGNSSSGSGKSKSKNKGGNSQDGEGFPPPSGNKPKTTDELGDFSKLQEDPRLPLNVRQIFKITKSWKAIARTMCKTGTAMFLNLFEENEDLFYLFDRFQHLKRAEIQESMELKEHAATVMSTLDQSISSLNDYDNFINYLRSIGELHRKVPDFRRDHFWKIEEPFMKAVKQTLDERCNETIEEIYRIAIKLIIETIADGYGLDDDQKSASADPARGNNNDATGGGGGNGSNSNAESSSNNNRKGGNNEERGANQNNDCAPKGLNGGGRSGTQRINAAPGCPMDFARCASGEHRASQVAWPSVNPAMLARNSNESSGKQRNNNDTREGRGHFGAKQALECRHLDAVISQQQISTPKSSSEQATEKDNRTLRDGQVTRALEGLHSLTSRPPRREDEINNLREQHCATFENKTENNNNDYDYDDNNHHHEEQNSREIIEMDNKQTNGITDAGSARLNDGDAASKEARLRATMEILREILLIVSRPSTSASQPQNQAARDKDSTTHVAFNVGKKNHNHNNEKNHKLALRENKLLRNHDQILRNELAHLHCDHKQNRAACKQRRNSLSEPFATDNLGASSLKAEKSSARLPKRTMVAEAAAAAAASGHGCDGKNNNNNIYRYYCPRSNRKQIRLLAGQRFSGRYGKRSMRCSGDARDRLPIDNNNFEIPSNRGKCCTRCDVRVMARAMRLRNQKRVARMGHRSLLGQNKLLITKRLTRVAAGCSDCGDYHVTPQDLGAPSIGINENSCENYNKLDGIANANASAYEKHADKVKLPTDSNDHRNQLQKNIGNENGNENKKLEIVKGAECSEATLNTYKTTTTRITTNNSANSNHHARTSDCCASFSRNNKNRLVQTGQKADWNGERHRICGSLNSCGFVASKSRKTAPRAHSTSAETTSIRLREQKNNNENENEPDHSATVESKSNRSNLITNRNLMRLANEEDNLDELSGLRESKLGRAHRVATRSAHSGRISRPRAKGFTGGQASAEAPEGPTCQANTKHSMKSMDQTSGNTTKLTKAGSNTNCAQIANNHCSNFRVVYDHDDQQQEQRQALVGTCNPNAVSDRRSSHNEIKPTNCMDNSIDKDESRRHRRRRDPFILAHRSWLFQFIDNARTTPTRTTSICSTQVRRQLLRIMIEKRRLNHIPGCDFEDHEHNDDGDWACIGVSEFSLDNFEQANDLGNETDHENGQIHSQESSDRDILKSKSPIPYSNGGLKAIGLSSDPKDLLELVKILYSLRGLDNNENINSINDKLCDQNRSNEMAGFQLTNKFITNHDNPSTLVYG